MADNFLCYFYISYLVCSNPNECTIMRQCCKMSLVFMSDLKPKHLSLYIKLICLYRLKCQQCNMMKHPEVIHFQLNLAIYSDMKQNSPWLWKVGGTTSARFQIRSQEICRLPFKFFFTQSVLFVLSHSWTSKWILMSNYRLEEGLWCRCVHQDWDPTGHNKKVAGAGSPIWSW